MKKLLTVVFLCLPAFGQTAYSGHVLYSGSALYGAPTGGAPTFYAALPQLWVDNNELTCGIDSSCYAGSPGTSLTPPAYEFALGSSTWISGVPPIYCTFSLPYATTGDGQQAAVVAMEACRTAGIAHGAAIGIILDIPPGIYSPTTGMGLVIPQSSNILATAPLIIRSTNDSTVAAMPEPVCAAGIQDNLATSINIGLNNPDCTGQNMYSTLGPQNLAGVLTGVTTISANTTTLSAIAAGGPQLVQLAHGYVSPGISYTIDIGPQQETVTAISGINQTGIYATFPKSHAYGVAVTHAPNGVTGCTGAGSFLLANGTCRNVSNYNYLQYLYQNQCSALNCGPIELCSAVAGDLNNCGAGIAIGPDHWEFEDGVASFTPGNTNDGHLIKTGDVAAQTSLSQFASHIHFRRFWVHGDWSSLATGYNSVSTGFGINGCQYCSVVGSHGSKLLRPGAEGHVGDGNGITLKVDNNWLEGQSSCFFPGGFSTTPGIQGFVPYTDVQFGRNRCVFPYSWLGASGGTGVIPNNNPEYGGANPPWIVGPTMVFISSSPSTCGESSTSCVVWVSGDAFHDSTSSWPRNNASIGGSNYALAAAGSWIETCGALCFPLNPPSVIPLDPSTASCSSNCGTSDSPVAFTMNSVSIVRKNCLELKEGERVLVYGLICDGVDESGGQNGTVATVNIRNTSGTIHGATVGQNYQSVISDLTLQDSIFRNSCEGIEVDARGVDPSGVTYSMTRAAFSNILEYSITGTNPGCRGEDPGMTLVNGHQTWNALVTENSAGTAATAVGFASIDLGVNVTASTPSGTSTVYTTSGSTAAANDTLCGSPSGAFLYVSGFVATSPDPNNSTPGGFQCTASTGTSLTLANSSGQLESSAAAFADPVVGNLTALGYQVVNIRTGEPISLSGCTGVTAFNQPTHSIGGHVVAVAVGPLATAGSTPWGGTWSSGNTTVTFPWTAPANAVDNTGTCVLANIESGPSYTSVTHNTFIGDPLQSVGNGPSATNGATFIFNHVFQDNIFLSRFGANNAGWYNPSVASPQEGTNTEIFNYDASSMTADHLVWPGRTASDYTPYGNNPNYPVSTPVMYFPETDYCTGTTYAGSGSNCVGFSGAMNIIPVAATITAVSITSNILTVTGNNSLTVGNKVLLLGTAESYLNGQEVIVDSATSSQFTASFTHGNDSPPNETGSCAVANGSTSGPCAILYPMPLTLPDYHGYELRSDSPFHNGASDGRDIGTIIPELDTAQITTTYTCTTPCGSPGPFPD